MACSQLVGKVVDLLFGAAERELGYMWNCSENVKTFKEEVEKLKDMKEVLQRRLDVAKNKGKDPAELENWMKHANDKLSEATKFITEEDESNKTCCDLPFCVNLGTLHHYGKTATKKRSSLLNHIQDGERFKTCVFDPLPLPQNTDLYQRKDLKNIDSQKFYLKEIVKAIEVEKIQIVGITGLGGVGKTTLAREVAAELKNKFDYTELVAISQSVNTEMIKKKVEEAAQKIINKQKVLIILDDLWEELKLDEVGIPCGSDYMNCKILLTSRSKDVCDRMNAQKNISVDPLKEEEAWTLFERVVGKTEWDNELKEVALKIVKECGGLPLFLQAVAKALRNKEIGSWNAALNRLKAPIHGDVKYKKEGIMQLKLSYDFLEDEVAKSCFLLCSMFPEDAIMDLERLTHYGLGIGIFDPHTSIQDAKHIVRGAIDTLKSSFLLLPENSRGKEVFKMHDLVRDMAMLITSKGNDKFLVESAKGLKEWPLRKDLEIYKKISLLGNKISKLPDHELPFRHLDTFLIQDNELSVVPDEFFGAMEQLKVLDMSGNEISSLPQSLKQLRILRLLDLSDNYSLCEISILGELTFLEILKLRRTGITNIPQEIGQLINLRLLDVYYCKDLSYVASGVISKLIWLEELYIGLKEGDCKCLLELTELKSLKILHAEVPRLQDIPEDFHFETLIEYRILENIKSDIETYGCKRILKIAKGDFPFPKLIKKLIQRSEMLSLSHIQDLDSILPALYPEGMDELKYIQLEECDNVRSLVKTCELNAMKTKRVFFSQLKEIELEQLVRLEVLCDSTHQYISFSNLEKIEVGSCTSLIKLFPLSVAVGLVNLKRLTIWRCERLVAVISAGDEETGGSEIEETGESKTELERPVVFPHLACITLSELPSLDSFYSGHSTIKYPFLYLIQLSHCRSMKRWSYGENHMPYLESQLQPSYSNINEYIAATKLQGDGWFVLSD